MKTGFIVGKFAPLTTGHINFINQASTKCDKLVVLLSYDSKWLDKQCPYMKDRLTLKNRLIWLKETYHDFDHIEIDFVDESDIPEYPHGWSEYSEIVKLKLFEHFGINEPDYVFSSETSYDKGFKQYFPNTEHVLIDPYRELFPIAATMLRNDVYENWNFLPSAVRKDFVFKVCVIGTESTGKTTLVKYLAKMFATSWVEEYGRIFCEKDLYGDESLLSKDDYATIAFRHKEFENTASRTANKILFSDTNAFITGFYQYFYEGFIDTIVNRFINREKYDLIIYLDDDVKWVDDGLRLNGSEEARKETKDLLEDMLKYYEVKCVRVSGSYEERLKEAYSIVNKSMMDIRYDEQT